LRAGPQVTREQLRRVFETECGCKVQVRPGLEWAPAMSAKACVCRLNGDCLHTWCLCKMTARVCMK
jgi:hypothetical protein